MVGVVGIEPTHPEETDLQSAATLQLRRTPNKLYTTDNSFVAPLSFATISPSIR